MGTESLSSTGARWDVVEEHLDEAAFLFDLWNASLRSHAYALDEVAAGPEERLLAHLDGLAAAGPEAAERLLYPALGGGDPGTAFAGAFVLAQAGEPELAAVLEAAGAAGTDARAAILRALAVAPDAGLSARLASRLDAADGAGRALLVAALAGRGEAPPAARVIELLRASDRGAVLAGLSAARALPPAASRPEVESLLRSTDPEVAAAAVAVGLSLGLDAAWERCRELAGAPGPGWAPAALLLALAGDAAAVPVLCAALADPDRRPGALLALGYTGRAEAAEAVIPHLADPALGPLAAEAFAGVTGLPLDAPYAGPRREEEGEEEAWDEAPEAGRPGGPGPGVDQLPVPDPHEIANWWTRERRRFDPGVRYLRGAPFSVEALWRELAEGPTGRRAALALELALRTGGLAQVDVFALSGRQRLELERARPLLARASAEGFRRGAPMAAPPGARSATPARRAAAIARADVVLTGIGLATPLGLGAAATFAAVRAGVARMEELPELYLCAPGDPRFEQPTGVVACGVPEPEGALRTEARAAEWLGWLAGAAFRDAERDAGLRDAPALRLGLFLAVPADPTWPAEELQQVPYHFHNHAHRDLLARVQVVRCGNAGGLALLDEASRALRARQIDVALVAGADSRLFPRTLRALDAQDRLKCGRHTQGFLPGEAGGVAVLELAEAAAARGRRPRAVLRSVALERSEPGPLPETGVALARLLTSLLAGSASPPIVVCDLNGEHQRMREWGYAVSRLGNALPAPVVLEHPALLLGDVGAASGSVLIGHAVRLLEAKHTGRGAAVVWAASDDGERRGALLELC